MDNNSLKLESNLKNKTNPQKHSNTWRLNDILFNNEWINSDVKEEIKKCPETNESEHTTSKIYGTQ